MELSRIGGGVYKICLEDGSSRLVSGKLSHVNDIAKAFGLPYTIKYLHENGQTLSWHPVSVEKHLHYHGPQLIELLQWFHQLDCPLGKPGFQRFAKITGVSAGRIQDAMRRADTSGHKPLSHQAMLYLRYKVNEHLQLHRFPRAANS